MSHYIVFLLCLLPAFSFAGLVGGATALKDNELETYIAVGTDSSWSDNEAVFYTYEVGNPIQDSVKKGLTFNSNFKLGPLLFKSTLNVNSKAKDVYVFPYRSMSKIWCDDHLRNEIRAESNGTSYRFWLDMWASECKILANYLNTNRLNRQSKLKDVVKQLSGYANTYLDSTKEFSNFELKTQSSSSSVDEQQSNIEDTISLIEKLKEEASKKVDQIGSAEKFNAASINQADELKGEIDQNQNEVKGIEETISTFEDESKTHEESQTGYDQNAEASLAKLQELIALLKEEAPENTALESVMNLLKDKNDVEAFEETIRSVLPA